VRPALVADGLAELQVRWPTVPIASCETRQLAKEWVYRYLAAAHTWANTVDALAKRLGTDLNRPKVSLAFTPTRRLEPSIPGRSPIVRYRPRSIDVRGQRSGRGAQIDHHVCRRSALSCGGAIGRRVPCR
jgi:hypothetical protein